ncbi:hypothetical protein TL18_04765 [Methanobrevibacter sp. YE315]|uniref:hypothetical protein n=1 Tax=Methanobrevibacter sp. YE315 TaxID=1609968 RepID=UPI000764CF62|nr:hypothetical protein [Methanobrevibacter sp. YE315]AMD17390.1 hypothetical protein TL18_04765 [Methanobrevibacter sp. YE315]
MDIRRTALIAIIAIMVVSIVAFAYISMNTTETKVEIDCNTTIMNGDYIGVILKDNYRNVIPGQVVDLKILDDSGWAHKFNVTTDEFGRGYIQIQGFDNGNYTVHATFNGTVFLKESHSNKAFKIDDGYSY